MAHLQQTLFVQTIIENLEFNSVLELGSYNVNGSIRKVIGEKTRYIGVDLKESPTVDHVYDGVNLELNEIFDLVLCCEVFEHDPHHLNTFKNMYNHLSKDGVFIFTCASTGRPEHGTERTNVLDSPGTNDLGWNYYKNLTSSTFERNFELKDMFSNYRFVYHKTTQDLYFLGVKGDINLNVTDIVEKAMLKIREVESQLRRERPAKSIFKILRSVIVNVDIPLRYILMHISDRTYQNYLYRREKLRKGLGLS